MARLPKVPPLVGKSEAAEIIGVDPNNMVKLRGLPAPLNDREECDVQVRATPVWRRVEIEKFAEERNARRAAAAVAP